MYFKISHDAPWCIEWQCALRLCLGETRVQIRVLGKEQTFLNLLFNSRAAVIVKVLRKVLKPEKL